MEQYAIKSMVYCWHLLNMVSINSVSRRGRLADYSPANSEKKRVHDYAEYLNFKLELNGRIAIIRKTTRSMGSTTTKNDEVKLLNKN